MTPATIEAFRDHGQLRATLEADIESAHHVIETLERTAISLEEVTDQLLEEGIALFSTSLDRLVAAVNHYQRGDSESVEATPHHAS